MQRPVALAQHGAPGADSCRVSAASPGAGWPPLMLGEHTQRSPRVAPDPGVEVRSPLVEVQTVRRGEAYGP